MSYDYRFINKQSFTNSVSYTLLIENTENEIVLASYRIEKTFKINENLIDKEYLRTEAKKEIARIIYEKENPVIEEVVDNGDISE